MLAEAMLENRVLEVQKSGKPWAQEASCGLCGEQGGTLGAQRCSGSAPTRAKTRRFHRLAHKGGVYKPRLELGYHVLTRIRIKIAYEIYTQTQSDFLQPSSYFYRFQRSSLNSLFWLIFSWVVNFT
mgnify:CR=1|jgi:hypothetical protein